MPQNNGLCYGYRRIDYLQEPNLKQGTADLPAQPVLFINMQCKIA